MFSRALVAPTQNLRVFLNSPKYIFLCLGPITTGWSSATVFWFLFYTLKKAINCKTKPFSETSHRDSLIFWCVKRTQLAQFLQNGPNGYQVQLCFMIWPKIAIFSIIWRNWHDTEKNDFSFTRFFWHNKIAVCPYIMSLKMDWFHSLLPFLSLSQRNHKRELHLITL